MGGRRRFTLPVPVVALCILTLTASHLEADSAKIWAGHAKEFEELLENAEVVSIKEIGSGANNPKRVTLRQGERTLRGLWKPIQRGSQRVGVGELRNRSRRLQNRSHARPRHGAADSRERNRRAKRITTALGRTAAASTRTSKVTITRPSPGSNRSRACVSSTQSSATGIAARGTTWSTTSGTSF